MIKRIEFIDGENWQEIPAYSSTEQDFYADKILVRVLSTIDGVDVLSICVFSKSYIAHAGYLAALQSFQVIRDPAAFLRTTRSAGWVKAQ